MSSQSAQGSGSRSQEFTVISNCDPNKKFSVLQFVSDKDLGKTTHISLARENNLKEYKSAYNIDMMPTTGAGSEFGREAKEEARRKKFGYIRRRYNPEAQPWLMQIGAEKEAKRYKGTRNGGILENASYFIFSKKRDGTFEAFPVEEWYNFKPTISYSNLNAEEAEEEFAKRDKNLNMFNIMVRKRLKKEDEEEDSKEKVKRDIKSKGLMLTEMEDWGDMSDEDGPNAADSDDSINGKMVKGKGKGKGRGKKKKEKDTDDEAVEDSDDGDKEAKQVDYMSDTSDSDSDMEGRADKSKYEEKGVEDEDGLREIVVESDEEKGKPEEEKKEKTKDSDASSSSSESESDDPDNDGKGNEFTKAFLMTGSKKDRGKSPVPRSATPTDDRKRKLQGSPSGSSPSTKKVKQEPAFLAARPSTPVSAGQGSRDGLTEESVKRYLLRKPMSSKDLVKLFKTKKLGISIEELVTRISTILKKLNTKQLKINGVIHFSMGE